MKSISVASICLFFFSVILTCCQTEIHQHGDKSPILYFPRSTALNNFGNALGVTYLKALDYDIFPAETFISIIDIDNSSVIFQCSFSEEVTNTCSDSLTGGMSTFPIDMAANAEGEFAIVLSVSAESRQAVNLEEESLSEFGNAILIIDPSTSTSAFVNADNIRINGIVSRNRDFLLFGRPVTGDTWCIYELAAGQDNDINRVYQAESKISDVRQTTNHDEYLITTSNEILRAGFPEYVTSLTNEIVSDSFAEYVTSLVNTSSDEVILTSVLSDDGENLYYLTDEAIYEHSMTSDETREVIKIGYYGPVNGRSVGLSPDAKYLSFQTKAGIDGQLPGHGDSIFDSDVYLLELDSRQLNKIGEMCFDIGEYEYGISPYRYPGWISDDTLILTIERYVLEVSDLSDSCSVEQIIHVGE